MRRAGGFTLIEISVALAIGALVLALAAPALGRLYARVQFNAAVRGVEDGLSALPRLAWALGEEGSLAELSQRHLEIPEGWELAGAEAIFVRRNGICAGGALTLVAGDIERRLVLDAPFCTVRRAD